MLSSATNACTWFVLVTFVGGPYNTKAELIQDPKPHFPIIQNLRRVKSVEITNQISEQFLFKVSLPLFIGDREIIPFSGLFKTIQQLRSNSLWRLT